MVLSRLLSRAQIACGKRGSGWPGVCFLSGAVNNISFPQVFARRASPLCTHHATAEGPEHAPDTTADPGLLLEAAQGAWLRGDDLRAELQLLAAGDAARRRGDEAAQHRAKLSTAQYALVVDDPQLARHVLRNISKPSLVESDVGLLAELLRCRAEGKLDGPITGWIARAHAVGRASDRARVFVELAVLARVTRSGRDAAAVVAEALAQDESDDVMRFRLLAERARLLLAARNFDACRAYFRDAISVAESFGWVREHARLLLFYGTRVAPALGERPMAYIRSAAIDLACCGTWRDRERLRDALHEHGRRIEDRETSANVSRRLTRADREAASLRGMVLRCVDEWASAAGPEAPSAWKDVVSVLESSRELTEAVHEAGAELLELLARTLVERTQLVSLVQSLSSLERCEDVRSVAQDAVRCAARLLDADRVVLAACLPDGSREVLACHPALEEAGDDGWRETVQDRQRTTESVAPSWPDSPSPRRETEPLGPVMVVPLAAQPFEGVLYADKLLRAGTFRASDRSLLVLLGDHVARVLARVRLRADRAEEVALRTGSTVAGSGAVSSIVPMAEVEKQAHLAALEACGGKVVMAARALGVSKTQFYAKLHAWGCKTKQPRSGQ